MHGIHNIHQCMTYNSTHTVCVGQEYIYGTTDVASNASVMVISTPRGNAAPLNDLISPAIGLEATFFLMSLSSVLMLITVVYVIFYLSATAACFISSLVIKSSTSPF